MRERVKSFIREWNMIEPGDRVLAGVSGGADSVCLCLILAELSAELDFSLEIIHVEHGIRGEESIRDAEFVRNLCEGLGLCCHVIRVDVPEYAKQNHLGTEEAARILRYEAFAEEAERGDKIALAHHMEDNAETMLMQLVRGSGIDGLCGMRPVREGGRGEVYIRPFLALERRDIEEYLRQKNQPFCEDSTNADADYNRNRIRHRVMPELCEVNRQAIKHMNDAAERMREVRDYLDEQEARCGQDIIRKEADAVYLDAEKLQQLPKVLGMRLLHRAIGLAGRKKDVTSTHLDAVWALLDRQTGCMASLPGGMVARREYQEIAIRRKVPDGTQGICVEILEEDMKKPCFAIPVSDGKMECRIFSFDGNMGKIPRKMYTKWFDYDMIKNGFSVRTRKPKDYFVLDAEGHHKKIEDYYVDEKVPAAERDSRLLLTQGAKVLWIVGGRMGYGAGIAEHTRMILEITYVKEE